ncbi:hypothetical protein AVEN_148574-1 [Araneus ventricosus]|uniref:Uncharacterized protein n=1 Tax=Araneus ventricosus TaxID=182803 RepID=A0A4Y2WRR6_ARAVE|nr:hypothetical protein AVEN_148574-1 [Araneus ventricosus]
MTETTPGWRASPSFRTIRGRLDTTCDLTSKKAPSTTDLQRNLVSNLEQLRPRNLTTRPPRPPKTLEELPIRHCLLFEFR